MRRLAYLGLLIATVLGLGVTAPTLASAAPQRELPALVQSSAAPAPAARSDASSYAQRERHDRQVQNYQGGSVIVIGASGAALLVLLLLLVLVI
jgi:hypothetical protein